MYGSRVKLPAEMVEYNRNRPIFWPVVLAKGRCSILVGALCWSTVLEHCVYLLEHCVVAQHGNVVLNL